MEKSQPIGFFDSGVGGTSIWKEVHQLLPFENTIYLADSKHAPYGNKKPEEIIQLSIKNTEKLLAYNCKLIIVACNTATTSAINILREKFDLPIIGVEPAIKSAALNTKTKSVGVLATKGTLNSTLFHKTSENFAKDIVVTEIIGEGLVPLIEDGDINSKKLRKLLIQYTKPMIDANADYIVLGCTHYPYLIPILREILPDHIHIIDSGFPVAKHTKNILLKNEILNDSAQQPRLQFFSNSHTKTLQHLLEEYEEEIEMSFMDF